MWIIVFIVFLLHSLAEIGFGLRAFLTGSFSSQPAEEAVQQPSHLAAAARFLGAALVALGVLGAVVLIGPGVRSEMGFWVALVLAVFHGVGCLGVVVTARAHPGFLGQTHARGALIVHLVLAVGFLVSVLVHLTA